MGAAVPRPGARKPRRFRTRQCRPFPAQRTASSVECYCSRDAAAAATVDHISPEAASSTVLNKAASHTNTEVSHSLAAQIADPWPRQLLSGPLAPPHATRNGSTVSFELRAQQRWWRARASVSDTSNEAMKSARRSVFSTSNAESIDAWGVGEGAQMG
jgi:hypothetical protein